MDTLWGDHIRLLRRRLRLIGQIQGQPSFEK